MTADECYVSVDVEAAGPIPGEYSLLSLGACLVRDVQQTFYAELQPISMRSVPEAIAIAGLSLQTLTEAGQPPEAAMRAFAEWLDRVCKGAIPVFVGFNAGFDWSFVNWYFLRYSGANPFGIGGIDIKAYFMGMTGVTWDETRSSRLPERFRLAADSSGAHNALDDAVQQAKMFAAMLDEARTRSHA